MRSSSCSPASLCSKTTLSLNWNELQPTYGRTLNTGGTASRDKPFGYGQFLPARDVRFDFSDWNDATHRFIYLIAYPLRPALQILRPKPGLERGKVHQI